MTIRRLFVLVALSACQHRATSELTAAHASVFVAALSGDSIVLDRLRRSHPCPATLPPLRARADSLPVEVRCTLVATAIATLHDSSVHPALSPDLSRFRLDRVACVDVRAVTDRNANNDVDSGRWIVAFLSDQQPSVAVTIDRIVGITSVHLLPMSSESAPHGSVRQLPNERCT